jgi:hypothetical protein
MKNIFIFKKLTFTIIIILLPFSIFCQPAGGGTLDYLLSSNGFKQIKLLADVKRLETDKLAYMDGIDSLDADSCYKLCYNDDDLLKLDNGLSLNLVGLRTYKNKIVNIYLFFPRDDGYAILKNFEANYGKFTSSPGEFMYDWQSNEVTLSLRYKQAAEMGVAIFTCKSAENKLAKDSRKRKAEQSGGKTLLGSL